MVMQNNDLGRIPSEPGSREPSPSGSAASGFDRLRFRDRISSARKCRKMSLEEVAQASGFTKSHIWELENGRAKNPTVRAVWGLAGALGVSPKWLLGLDDEAPELDPLAHQIAALINCEIARRQQTGAIQ